MKILVINPLAQTQISEIVALDRLCFDGLWSSEAYDREINSPNSSLIALWVQTLESRNYSSPAQNNTLRPIGIGCLWSIVEEAHITLLGIHPDYRRQGLGEFLLYILLEDAIKRGLQWATLEVKTHNHPAIALYKKLGFKIVGKRKGYYQKTGEDALILWHKGLGKLEFQQNLADRKQERSKRLAASYFIKDKKNK